MGGLLERARDLIPTIVVLAGGVSGMWLARYLLFGRARDVSSGDRIYRQLAMVALGALFVVTIILVLPLGDASRSDLLGLFGLLVSAMIALSSTTFVGNAMAGLMLRALGKFRPGDFLRVGEHFGRVSELGILHTEIQTEERDLTTLPNLYLVSTPVKVVRYSGTLVAASVSLGYDVPRARVQRILKQAAADAELEDPFVLITQLGDYSVSYRVAGILTEVRQLVTVKSRLRGHMLDALHAAGIEIVSPAFMNQRVHPADATFLPERYVLEEQPAPVRAPEDVIFDKADQAQSMVQLAEEVASMETEIAELASRLEEAESPELRKRIEVEIARLRNHGDNLRALLDQKGADRQE